MRFTKDQIDGICKDIRYPNDFFLDLIFDEDQSSNVSAYEEDVSKWKNVLSDFLMKSFKSNKHFDDNTNNNIKNSEMNKRENEKKLLENLYKENESPHKDIIESNSSSDKIEKEDDLALLMSNTMDKAKNILEKYSKNNNSQEEKEEDEEDDEDIENYLKNLENKKK